MESRGTVPAPVIGADDAPEVAALFERPGPFLTVYMNTEPDVEQAAQHSQARWRNLRRDMEAAGASPAAIDAIDAIVPNAHLAGRTMAAIADANGLQLARGITEPVSADRATWSPVPAVGPLLEWQQSSPTHVVVLCDRVGADIALFTLDATSPDALLSVGSDDQNDPVLRKTKPGGWSQRRYQERAENSWEANMRAVAARLAKLTQIVPPRLVIVAGDVRAVQLLRENLPPRVSDTLVEIEGQRAVDGGIDDVAEEAVKMVASAVATDTTAIIGKFREECGQADRAADGVVATLAALSEARVDTLLVHDDPTDERECWFAPDAPLAAVEPESLKSQGIDSPVRARLVDVAIRTAFQTGARVCVVPSTTATERLGAILRY